MEGEEKELTVADLDAQKSAGALAEVNAPAQQVAAEQHAPVVSIPPVEAPVSKSPQELAAEAHKAEEARRAAQVDFDAKIHGVGTHPQLGPQSVTDLHKFVMELFRGLHDRVKALEEK